MSKATSPPPATADPMLQGTYQQDTKDDLDDSSQQLADFERRLANGAALHSPQKHAGSSKSRPAPQQQRQQAANNDHHHHQQQPPMRASFGQPQQPSSQGGQHAAGARRMSEEEQTERMEKEQEIAEVRALGGGDDSD